MSTKSSGTTYLKVIVWPLVVLAIVYILRDPISGLIDRSDTIMIEVLGVKVEIDKEKADEIKEKEKEIKDEVNEIKTGYTQLFDDYQNVTSSLLEAQSRPQIELSPEQREAMAERVNRLQQSNLEIRHKAEMFTNRDFIKVKPIKEMQ